MHRTVQGIVVAPALVAGVVGRVDVDALHLALILWQQGFQCLQIIPVDDHILAAVVLGVLPLLIKTVLLFQLCGLKGRIAGANLLMSVNSPNKKSEKNYCRVQLSIRQL